MAFGVMLVGMLAMGTWVSWQIERSVSEVKAASTALSVSNLITPHLQELAFEETLSEENVRELERALQRPDLRASIASLKIWRKDGLIVYSNEENLSGKKFPLNPNLQKAWAGSINVQFDGPPYEEDARERAAGLPLLEVFAPVHSYETGKVIAVVEFQERAEALNAELVASEWQTWLATALITLNMMGCLFVIVANGSRTIDQQRAALTKRVSQLSELLHQNRILQERIERAAQNATEDNERLLRGVGYDLHDGVAQLVGLALLRLDKVKGSQQDRENLKAIQRALTDALTDIRNICKGLLLPEVEKLTLKEALMFMIRHHERTTGTSIVCRTADLPDEAPQFVKIALCRFVQEGLNNAFKHAGGRGQQVTIDWDGVTIAIEVADQGPGLGASDGSMKKSGLGLAGLRDRIESIGGIVTMKSRPDAGTCIKASLPLAMGVSDAA
jgi:signal transduction histidine kinase